jgi:soluble lytic murein transglycosylase-like protein
MQVMVGTAKLVNHETVSASKLRNNIEYNVMTSMKLLRKLHNLYGDWKTTFGAYNCGYPCINGYAVQVYNHQINWK